MCEHLGMAAEPSSKPSRALSRDELKAEPSLKLSQAKPSRAHSTARVPGLGTSSSSSSSSSSSNLACTELLGLSALIFLRAVGLSSDLYIKKDSIVGLWALLGVVGALPSLEFNKKN